MATPGFAFEDCLLKHYVRTQGWLPSCRARKRAVSEGRAEAGSRRLRYFTFCAVGAIDVLMLDVASVIRRSNDDRFDTVVFFDKDPDAVLETQKRIPGAEGFPGDFTKIVLTRDVDEEATHDPDFLAPPQDQADEFATHEHQRILAQHRAFVRTFPFDIVNLDLEEFVFKARDPFPGRVINSLRKVFEWQRLPLRFSVGRRTREEFLEGFTLMFTTQIGPPNIDPDYTDMLRDNLAANLQAAPDLQGLMTARTDAQDLAELQRSSFDLFFKLGLPKILASILMEQDWYVDPGHGVRIFEFKRAWTGGEYSMLHLIMDVKRQQPPRERRAPNLVRAQAVEAAYSAVIRQIFEQREVFVTNELASSIELRPTLAQIRARRRRYFPEDE
jgi:hypothetical protein